MDDKLLVCLSEPTTLRITITDQLRNAGYKMFEAAGAKEALRPVGSYQKRPD